MNRNKLFSRLVIVIPCMLFLVGMLWYQGGERLSSEEIDHYIDLIENQPQNPGGQHDMAALRQFLETDDGKAFYTVNLYKYHDQAQYQDGRSSGGTGREAFDRFSKVMVRLLLQHSSHPIFGSNWASDNNSGWDRIVIVRYRSRRDIVDIFASQEFAEASAHKWAGLERNERLLVQGLHIPEFYLPMLLSALLIGFIFYAILRVQRKKHVLSNQ